MSQSIFLLLISQLVWIAENQQVTVILLLLLLLLLLRDISYPRSVYQGDIQMIYDSPPAFSTSSTFSLVPSENRKIRKTDKKIPL